MRSCDPDTLLSKIKRNLTCWFPSDPFRSGACRRCGACCRMPYTCPALRFGPDGLATCAIYAIRPQSCRVYPRTRREQVTRAVCGFSFGSR